MSSRVRLLSEICRMFTDADAVIDVRDNTGVDTRLSSWRCPDVMRTLHIYLVRHTEWRGATVVSTIVPPSLLIGGLGSRQRAACRSTKHFDPQWYSKISSVTALWC
jgi:hypothetical protein